MKRIYTFSVVIILLLLQIVSCTKDEVKAPPMLNINEQDLSLNFPVQGTTRSIVIKTNVDDVSLLSSEDWCSAEYIDGASKKINIIVSENSEIGLRTATIDVLAGNLSETINITQLGVDPVIMIESKEISLDFKSQKIGVELATNLELEVICSDSWIKLYEGTKSAMVDLSYQFDIEQLAESTSQRTGKIYFQQKGGVLKDSVVVNQGVTTSDQYEPGETTTFEKDKKIKILSATLTPSDKYQQGQNVDKSIDEDNSTIYHSPWSGMTGKPEITLEYELDPEDATVANYIVLHPRTSGPNGIIKTATVWVNTAEDANFKQVGSLEVSQSNNPVMVRFNTPVVNPRNVKIVVTDTYANNPDYYFVSLAEFECYESKSLNGLEEDMHYFTDASCSELQAGTTLDDIANIKNPFLQNIAVFLRAGIYPTEMRVHEMEAYREVADLAKELKTSPYSQFENITGIHFAKDEEVVVFVGETNGESVALRVRDFGESGDDNTYVLNKGVNVLTMKGKGNGYINYYTPNYQSASKIKIHIASGRVNGYFDRSKHTNADGSKLLDNAVSEIMDIKGERVHLAYSVSSLKTECYSEMGDLIALYDSIVGSEQTIMGLRKYNRLPKNHMFGRVMWSGYMHADATGAAFHDNTMHSVANLASMKENCWGVAHEFGHVNQVRPGMKWVGTSECTNNLYSAWIQYCLAPDYLRLEHEKIGGVKGARFNAYFNNAFVNNQEWGLQAGPDKTYGLGTDGKWAGDHFVKLCPLWQLQLYFHIAGEGNSWNKPYFWADVFEKVRNTDESGLSHGELQVNFVKNVCDAVELDMSDFFINNGMLQVVDKYFGDYSSAQKTITQSMIDEAVSYAGKYAKPETDYVQYISGNSIDAYMNKLDVSGQYDSGVSGATTKTIQHTIWKNVTVFETYNGDVISHITMVGTGSDDSSFSEVPYPDGSTRIEAVGWDGTRVKVFGN